MRVPPQAKPRCSPCTLSPVALLPTGLIPYSPTMDITDGKSNEPPSNAEAGQTIERLYQRRDHVPASGPRAINSRSFQSVAAVLSTARELFAVVSKTDLRSLSNKELRLLIAATDQFMQYLQRLILEASEELFHRLSARELDEKHVGTAVHLLTDTLQLSVAETCLLNKLARPP